MRVIKAFTEKPFHAIAAAAAVFFLPPVIQLVITPLAFEIWYKTLIAKPLNTMLYIAFAAAFGLLVSLYFYARNKCLDCDENAVSTGFGGAVFGFIVGVCPACFSLVAVLLPLSTNILITTHAPAFTALSITVVAYSIYRLGGLKSA